MVLTDRIRTRLQEINNRERDQQQALNKVEVEAQPQVRLTLVEENKIAGWTIGIQYG